MLLLFFVELLLMVLLYPSNLISASTQTERAWVYRDLGPRSHDWIVTEANNRYQALVIDTGWLDSLSSYLTPKNIPNDNNGGFSRYNLWFEYVDARIKALSELLYFVLFRWCHLLLWLPIWLLLIVPAAHDGYLTWKIKQSAFKAASPTLHRLTFGLLKWGLLLLPIVFLIPLPFPPMGFPAALMLAAVLIGVSLSNLPKKI